MLRNLVRPALASLLALLGAFAAFAQDAAAGPESRTTTAVYPSLFEFAGSWAPLATEDVQNDSVPVDYLGLALTEEARVRALSYDESQKSMVERQCQGWGASYAVLGPFGLRISSQTEPTTKRLVSYTIDAWEDWNARSAPIWNRKTVPLTTKRPSRTGAANRSGAS